MKKQSYRDYLIEAFEQRKEKNSAYSLRAFARDLEILPATLSQILNKKKGLSIQCAKHICKKLNLKQGEKVFFCYSVGALHSRSKKDREFYQSKINRTSAY